MSGIISSLKYLACFLALLVAGPSVKALFDLGGLVVGLSGEGVDTILGAASRPGKVTFRFALLVSAIAALREPVCRLTAVAVWLAAVLGSDTLASISGLPNVPLQKGMRAAIGVAPFLLVCVPVFVGVLAIDVLWKRWDKQQAKT